MTWMSTGSPKTQILLVPRQYRRLRIRYPIYEQSEFNPLEVGLGFPTTSGGIGVRRIVGSTRASSSPWPTSSSLPGRLPPVSLTMYFSMTTFPIVMVRSPKPPLALRSTLDTVEVYSNESTRFKRHQDRRLCRFEEYRDAVTAFHDNCYPGTAAAERFQQ